MKVTKARIKELINEEIAKFQKRTLIKEQDIKAMKAKLADMKADAKESLGKPFMGPGSQLQKNWKEDIAKLAKQIKTLSGRQKTASAAAAAVIPAGATPEQAKKIKRFYNAMNAIQKRATKYGYSNDQARRNDQKDIKDYKASIAKVTQDIASGGQAAGPGAQAQTPGAGIDIGKWGRKLGKGMTDFFGGLGGKAKKKRRRSGGGKRRLPGAAKAAGFKDWAGFYGAVAKNPEAANALSRGGKLRKGGMDYIWGRSHRAALKALQSKGTGDGVKLGAEAEKIAKHKGDLSLDPGAGGDISAGKQGRLGAAVWMHKNKLAKVRNYIKQLKKAGGSPDDIMKAVNIYQNIKNKIEKLAKKTEAGPDTDPYAKLKSTSGGDLNIRQITKKYGLSPMEAKNFAQLKKILHQKSDKELVAMAKASRAKKQRVAKGQ